MRVMDLDRSALERHGLVTLRSSGLSRAGWYRALRAGAFEQLHPGVARLAGTPRTYRQRVAAAVMAVDRPTAVASHRSAASLWLGHEPDDDVLVDLLFAERGRTRRLDGVLVHRPTDLARLSPQRVDGIRCTNLLRTLVDLGAVDPEGVQPLLGHALSTGAVSVGAVQAALLEHARPGRGGVTALRAAVDEWVIDARPADSVLEVAFRRLVARHHLPPVEFHPRIEGWEVDFRFVGTRLLVECDGWMTHGLDRTQFERDRRRDDDLRAAGWIVSRHTYRAITRRSADTARRLRRLLATESVA